jgi:conjugal transfer pilus assembly protein TrbC
MLTRFLKLIINACYVMVLVIIALLCCTVVMASSEDYVGYAKVQQAKIEALIAPYQTQVKEIIKNAEIRQSQPDIKKFKKELEEAAKAQCPMQKLIAQKEQEENLINKNYKQIPIIIFVSFSMPKESIKGWIAQAQKVGASVYIRGLVNNSFKDTAKAVSELVQDQVGGVLIDPNLFKKYSITQVPAVVVVNGKDEKEDFVVYGDVSLDYALEKISNAMQEADRKDLLKAIKILRSSSKNA